MLANRREAVNKQRKKILIQTQKIDYSLIFNRSEHLSFGTNRPMMEKDVKGNSQ